jgi:hypothetical protein
MGGRSARDELIERERLAARESQLERDFDQKLAGKTRDFQQRSEQMASEIARRATAREFLEGSKQMAGDLRGGPQAAPKERLESATGGT